MKKLLGVFTVICLCLSLILSGVISAETTTEYYGNLVGLGDSWCQGVGLGSEMSTKNAVVLTANALGWQYTNFGQGGKYASDVLSQMKNNESDQYKGMLDADTVFVHGGINDIQSNYRSTLVGNSYIDYTDPTLPTKYNMGRIQKYYDAETKLIEGKTPEEYFYSYLNGATNNTVKALNDSVDIIRAANPDALVIVSTLYCNYTGGIAEFADDFTFEGLTDQEKLDAANEMADYYFRKYFRQANEGIIAFAANYDNVVVLDDASIIPEQTNSWDVNDYMNNGHPRAPGYQLLSDGMVSLIREYYGEESPTFAHTATTAAEATTASEETTTTTANSEGTTTTTTTKATTTTTTAGEVSDTYDYYSIFSADTDELPILYSPTGHCKYEVVEDTVRNDGGKIVKVMKNGMYNNEPNVAFKQDFSELAKDSVGIRVFLAKSEDATAGKLVSFAFGSTVTDKTYIDTGMWGTANSGNCTTEGSWYEFYWDNTTGLSTATVYDNTASNNGYRVVPASQTISTANKIDADFISGMDSIYIRYNLNATTGHYAPNYYFFDDVQFIYPKGKSPSSSTSPVTMKGGAQIRLSEQRGIRFLTNLDIAKIAELEANGYTVEYGTLIAPKDLLEGAALTFDLDASKYVNVPYTASQWHMGEEGQIAGSLVSIKEDNITREFIGRGYIKATKDGETTYTYANYDSNDVSNNTRSLAYVANALKNDTENYDKLNDTIKALVDEWAGKLSQA